MAAQIHHQPSVEGATLNGSSHSLARATSSGEKEEKDKQELSSKLEPPSDVTPGPEVPTEYPSGPKLFILMVALCLAVFLVALDNTIITTAIPRITDQFQSLDDVGWYGSAYLLAVGSTQLLFGKFYTFFPLKFVSSSIIFIALFHLNMFKVFLTGISIFELGSLICGVAPNSNALIIGRAIAGLGSAGIFTGALIIIAHSVPLAKRPMYTGLIGAMYGIASVAGPLMGQYQFHLTQSISISLPGGAFTDKVSWRWCFYINLPIGGVAVTAIAIFFKTPETAKIKKREVELTLRQKVEQFDPIGTLLFIPAIISLLLALQWGGTKYAWDNGRIIALFVIFGVFICAFVGVQVWQQDNATVPPRIISQRSIWAGGVYSLFQGASFFVFVFYLPIWFQAIKGTTAVKSGIDNLPMILGLVISSMSMGALVTTLGYYAPFMILSTVMMTIGAGLMSTFTTTTGSSHWIGYQALYGLGLGFGMQGPLIAAQTVLELNDIPIGTSCNMFLQTLGGALFISVGQNVFQNKLISGLVSRVPGVSPAIVFLAGATNLKNAIDPQFLPAVLEVYNSALMSTFQVGIALAGLTLVGSLAMEWRSVKGKKIEMAMA
ncbi:major facilitator superfamily transporter [Favolaschia claudopus]|uniref:Major facilitator superfamily transporter n=1 Tax=Favolaschia claudopus TaxID=2862362 RepID=A0AAW0EH20_9AGAR